jgi:hypothetical protein
MATTPDVTIRFRIDQAPFQRSMWDAAQTLGRVGYQLAGQTPPPRAPYPRTFSGLTAREYRAARRAYGRAVKAWKRGVR